MRKGIALLITLLFIMLITISIGISLKQVNTASSHVEDEKFLYQSSAVLDDVLTLLKSSQELNDINSSQDFSAFLAETSFIPFEAEGIKVSLELSSARSKFNVNTLVDASAKPKEDRVAYLKQYVSNYMVITTYVDILLDSMGKVKEDLSYNSELFNNKPYLFRDYIVSAKHLDELNGFYTSFYHEQSLENINFKELFYFGKNNDYKIDLSYATTEVWEMMLGCDTFRASELSATIYEALDDIGLSDDEKLRLAKFDTSFFEPYIDVRLNIMQDKQSANIRFEYDIKNKKGTNFVYEI